MANTTRAVLIAGPTASGKSALAMSLAEEAGGAIINADSMQVYADLRIITARPGEAEEARVAHDLYGHVDAGMNYSVGHYLGEAREALARAERVGKLPIFVGGTGLYFKALTHGLASIPPIPHDVRKAVRDRLAAEGPQALHADLAQRDAAAADRLEPGDRQRVARALEVVLATGRPLAEWHNVGIAPLIAPEQAIKLFIAPERAELYRRIDARFETMLEAGALDEVSRLAARRLDPLLPIMKAHGVPWLLRYLAGELSLPEAAKQSKLDIRHYAKRQHTWFRHQLAEWTPVEPANARAGVLRALGR